MEHPMENRYIQFNELIEEYVDTLESHNKEELWVTARDSASIELGSFLNWLAAHKKLGQPPLKDTWIIGTQFEYGEASARIAYADGTSDEIFGAEALKELVSKLRHQANESNKWSGSAEQAANIADK